MRVSEPYVFVNCKKFSMEIQSRPNVTEFIRFYKEAINRSIDWVIDQILVCGPAFGTKLFRRFSQYGRYHGHLHDDLHIWRL